MNSSYLSKNSVNPYFAVSDLESEESRNFFLARFASLPQQVQKLISGEDTEQNIKKLSEMYDLDVAQTELISWTIRNVASGSAYIKELPEIISRVADLNIEQAKNISNYIFQNLFTPVLEDIKRIQKDEFGAKMGESKEQAKASAPISPIKSPLPPPIIKPPTFQKPPGAEDLSGNIINLRKP